MAGTFSSFLLAREYTTSAELEEATQATVLYGGRLGTALIELGLLTPERLDAALAEYLELPPIPKEWLAKPDPAARAALHVDLVKKHRAFPLLFEKRTLHLGMLDPRNTLALDELAFASGCLIAPHVLPEFRFVQLLHRVYGVAPSARFRTLLDESHRARLVRERSRSREVKSLERAKELDELAIGPLAADVELTDESAFHVVPSAEEQAKLRKPEPVERVPAAPRAPEAPSKLVAAAAPARAAAETPAAAGAQAAPAAASIAALEKLVTESSDRSDVIDSSVALADRFAEVAALFVVREGVAAGLTALRAGQALEVESIVLPLSGEGLVAACVRDRKPAAGLPAAALDKLLAKALRSEESAELAVFPVTIGERVVNLIVAQPASGPLPRTAAAALETLARLLGDAYERLIRFQKQKAAAPVQPGVAPAAKPSAAPVKQPLGVVPLAKRVVKAPVAK